MGFLKIIFFRYVHVTFWRGCCVNQINVTLAWDACQSLAQQRAASVNRPQAARYVLE